MREEAAFPVLLQMAQEFLPPHPLPVEYNWYDVRHIDVARLLGRWGKAEAVPMLQQTLAQLWAAEQQAPQGAEFQLWWAYEDALVYALGQLGQLDTIEVLNLAARPDRKVLWDITLILGYLGAEEVLKKQVIEISLDAPTESPANLVPLLLEDRLNWTVQEAVRWAERFGQAYLARFEG